MRGRFFCNVLFPRYRLWIPPKSDRSGKTPLSDLPVHYPRPTRQPPEDGRQYEWFVGNKKRKNPKHPADPVALDLAAGDTSGLAIIDKYGK